MLVWEVEGTHDVLFDWEKRNFTFHKKLKMSSPNSTCATNDFIVSHLLGDTSTIPSSLVLDQLYRYRGGRLGLGLFIIVGVIVSYLPQIRSSRGISPGFLFFGAVGNASAFANLVLLQAATYTVYTCFENTIALLQVFVQVACFWIFVFLFVLYFPRGAAAASTGVPVSQFAEENDETRPLLAPPESPPNTLNNDNNIETAPQSILIQESVFDVVNSEAVLSAEYAYALKVINVIILLVVVFVFVTIVALYSSNRVPFIVATWFGVFSAVCSLVLYLPQIYETLRIKTGGAISVQTLAMQGPGNFLFAYSLFLAPGANASSYMPNVMTGLLQFVLLGLCLHFKKLERDAAAADVAAALEGED
ncbi:hypothetical protein HK100_011359 [Physocladia obscura]|uniref:PQ loop repeat protein n=1 Tax=Physocladia obscura TaxID=109957 RepID=A0AAD5T1Y7_9FUNG|nr:hypothetical protein HK100_011359 [Physocladia obscura]